MPKFPKGSPEMADYMKSLRDKRGTKPVDPNKPKKLTQRQKTLMTPVDIPVMGSSTLILPEYFATELANGKYKLVNPMSQERNLSQRNGKLSLKLIRKPVENMVLLEGNDDPIPLGKFSKKDRTIIDRHFQLVDKYSNKPAQEVPTIYHKKPLERGRPEILKKNVEINSQRGKKAKPPKTPKPPQNPTPQPNIQMNIQEVEKKVGRPTKYETVEEKAQKKRIQTLASNKKKRAEKKALKQQQGTGLFNSSILTKGLLNTDLSNQGLTTQLTQTKNLVFGNEGLPTNVKNMLKKFGNEKIKSIYLIRTPVPKYITELLNVASLGEFNKNLKKANYDQLFHLAIVFRTGKGEVLLEKNENVNMSESIPRGEGTETTEVNLSQDLTINEVLQKTKEKMGDDRFLKYDAYDNNCQNFVLNILKANGLGNEEDYTFVKQDTEELFKTSPHLRTLARSVTDLASRFTGTGISNYKIQSVIFDKKKYSIDNAKKWLKTNGYLSPKVDETEDKLRFKQKSVDILESLGFTSYRTKPLGKSGIQLIIAYYKPVMEGEGFDPSDYTPDELEQRKNELTIRRNELFSKKLKLNDERSELWETITNRTHILPNNKRLEWNEYEKQTESRLQYYKQEMALLDADISKINKHLNQKKLKKQPIGRDNWGKGCSSSVEVDDNNNNNNLDFESILPEADVEVIEWARVETPEEHIQRLKKEELEEKKKKLQIKIDNMKRIQENQKRKQQQKIEKKRESDFIAIQNRKSRLVNKLTKGKDL